MLLINSFPKTRINDIIAPAGNVQTKRSYSYPSSRFSPLILLRSADLRSLPPDQLTPWPLCYARGGVSSQKKPGAHRGQREHPAERLKEIPKKLSDRGVLSPHPGAPDRVSARPRLSPPLVMSPHSPSPINAANIQIALQ